MKSVLAALARELDARGIGYLIIGGQAVLLYGEPRFTKDIDVTLALKPDRLPDVLALPEARNLRPVPSDPQDFVRRTFVLPCIHDESTLGVDFIFSFSEFQREAINRGVERQVDGTPVRFATAEDLLIQKIVASRPTDLSDARDRRQEPGT